MKRWKISNYEEFFSNIIKFSEIDLVMSLQKNQKDETYKKYYDKLKKKGKRRIYSINKRTNLYKIQKNIMKNFLNNIMITDSCYGFKKGYNYMDFLEPHTYFIEKNYYLRLDMENFFESISKQLLIDVIGSYFEIGQELNLKQKEKLVGYIIEIITYEGKIIQGGVTSPVISNIVFRQLDIRIERYCRKLDIEYSRYADDLLFSSKSNIIHSRIFLQKIKHILFSKGFKINYSKIIRAKNQICLNGYVVGNTIKISRRKMENLSRVLFYLNNCDFTNTNYIQELNDKISTESKKDKKTFNGKYSLINYLAGNRSFLISIMKYTDDKIFYDKIKRTIDNLEDNILKLYSVKV